MTRRAINKLRVARCFLFWFGISTAICISHVIIIASWYERYGVPRSNVANSEVAVYEDWIRRSHASLFVTADFWRKQQPSHINEDIKISDDTRIMKVDVWKYGFPMRAASRTLNFSRYAALSENAWRAQFIGVDVVVPVHWLWFNFVINTACICALFYIVKWNVRVGIACFRFKRNACRLCGYSLKGLSVPKCPECGRGQDASLVSSSDAGA